MVEFLEKFLIRRALEQSTHGCLLLSSEQGLLTSLQSTHEVGLESRDGRETGEGRDFGKLGLKLTDNAFYQIVSELDSLQQKETPKYVINSNSEQQQPKRLYIPSNDNNFLVQTENTSWTNFNVVFL